MPAWIRRSAAALLGFVAFAAVALGATAGLPGVGRLPVVSAAGLLTVAIWLPGVAVAGTLASWLADRRRPGRSGTTGVYARAFFAGGLAGSVVTTALLVWVVATVLALSPTP